MLDPPKLFSNTKRQICIQLAAAQARVLAKAGSTQEIANLHHHIPADIPVGLIYALQCLPHVNLVWM